MNNLSIQHVSKYFFIRFFLLILTISQTSTSCHKVPLIDDSGRIDIGVLHWFENEKTAYVFFSFSEREARLVNPEWRLGYLEKSASGWIPHPESPLDLDAGVHKHHFVKCADDRLCGSYSFHSEGQIASASLTFHYDKETDDSQKIWLTVQNHAKGTNSDAYSALIYGVFDKENEHLQVRVQNNFGIPNDDQIDQFGIERNFAVRGSVLQNVTDVDYEKARATAANGLIFPTSFCEAAAFNAETLVVNKPNTWLSTKFDIANPSRGACLKIDFLDKNSAVLGTGGISSFAHRNPDLSAGNSLIINSPLSTAIQLPIRLQICPEDPSFGTMVDLDFTRYQQHILGIDDRGVDLCFKIGEEDDFALKFDALLAQHLSDAKAGTLTGSSPVHDFIFVVLLHEHFAEEFRALQNAIAASLYSIAAKEIDAVSPRLVGSFVYASTSNFIPTATQRSLVLWCPQELLSQILDPTNPSFGNQNCTTSSALDLDLQVINFVAPMGPFPTWDSFHDYVDKFGDKGLAHNPSLIFNSVPHNANTTTEGDLQVTYFDGARYAIAAGEYAHVCLDRLDRTTRGFRAKLTSEDPALPGQPLATLNNIWLSPDGVGEYRIGIPWEYPFVGGVAYVGTLTGKAVSMIPFQRSSDAYETVGDKKWTAQSWDFGSLVQHCRRFCDNPYFDEGGSYQSGLRWRDAQKDSIHCTVPQIPTFNL